jgi:hypothetical protein
MGIPVAFVLIGVKHHAELAYDGIEGRVGERQCCAVGGSESHGHARREFSLGDLQHINVEIGCGDVRGSGQCVPERAGDDPRSTCRFQKAVDRTTGCSPRHLGGVACEDHWPKPPVVMLRNVPREAGGVFAHDIVSLYSDCNRAGTGGHRGRLKAATILLSAIIRTDGVQKSENLAPCIGGTPA